MSFYRGFGLYFPVRQERCVIHAQRVAEIGAWEDYGFVGTMPDLASAKLYVDWLREVGPDEAPARVLQADAEGHVVVVNGRQPDSEALLGASMTASAALIVENPVDAAVLARCSRNLIEACHNLEIASAQRGQATKVGNFFVTADSGDKAFRKLYLGSFGMSDGWNGDGWVATGIGDGWVNSLIERLEAKPMENYAHLVSPPERPSGYARSVFVEGDEPSLDRVSLERIREAVTLLCQAARWGPLHLTQFAGQVSGAAETIMELVGSKDDTPIMRCR